MPRPSVLAFVLAGGEGRRLRPLTRYLSKPALPFGSRHRIIDFVLSNLVNSGITDVRVLVQYQAQSLITYLRRAWSSACTGPAGGANIRPLRPHSRRGFQGTLDAVAQNLDLVDDLEPEVVAVFGADHIYRMDVRQMLDAHRRHAADVTVATVPVPREQAHCFGIVDVDSASRITRFREKPPSAEGIPGRPTHVRASMGNYLFAGAVLRQQLRAARERGFRDFGAHLLPEMTGTHRLLAYDFASNDVPGRRPHEEPAYWRDVGTIDSYFDAHVDTLGQLPRFEIVNPQWPVRGVLHGNVRVGEGAIVEDSIVLGGARIGAGARIRSAIIDAGCAIPDGETIGHDPDVDRRRFTVSSRGVVVVPRGYFDAAGGRRMSVAREVA